MKLIYALLIAVCLMALYITVQAQVVPITLPPELLGAMALLAAMTALRL
jgi:hypothetical protein